MKLTESAVEVILKVMRSKDLDPDQFSLELTVLDNGAMGMGFSKNAQGKTSQLGDLTVVVDDVIDSGGVLIDLAEVNGKMGLVFLAENTS
jgi:hypothetical protein